VVSSGGGCSQCSQSQHHHEAHRGDLQGGSVCVCVGGGEQQSLSDTQRLQRVLLKKLHASDSCALYVMCMLVHAGPALQAMPSSKDCPAAGTEVAAQLLLLPGRLRGPMATARTERIIVASDAGV
jgi:hypothetical protein